MIKIYFVRPKPEKNWEDMPVYLIATDKPESVWNWIYADSRVHREDEYFIQNEFYRLYQLLKVLFGEIAK